MRSAADSSEHAIEAPLLSSGGRLLTAALVLIAFAWTLAFLSFSFDQGLLAWDGRFAYLPAAEAVLEGDSPYPDVDDPILEEQKGYVYPPQLALVLAPLARLPVDLVAVLLSAAMVALVGATLYVLRVRDVACYAAAFLWMPVTSGVLFANVSIPLAFALALTWRYRVRASTPGIAAGLAASTKFVVWPVLVWMLATRRFGAAIWSAVVGVLAAFASWAVIGFAGFTEYPELLRRLSEIQASNSYSLVGIATSMGMSEGVGRVATLLVGGSLLVGCVLLGRREDDRRAFTCAVGAILALSPIVWLHYLVVLLVPLAIARPRFSLLWLLPIVLVVSPRPGYPDGISVFLPMLVVAIMIAVLLARPTPGRPAEEPA